MAILTNLLLFCACLKLTTCCEETFSNTNVTLVGAKDITNITGCFAPTEDLVKVSFIQILNENVPVLKKDSISGLPKLVDIIIENSGVTDLQSGCFADLPKIYLIKLKHNNFKTVREGVFNNLALSELCLTNNSIESVHPKAFNDIPNLSILFLDQNKISYWSSEWFFRSPKIAVLNFEHNWITSIPTRALQNVQGTHYDKNVNLNISTHVLLNNNRIRYFSDEAFSGIESFGWLFLHRNEIEEISEASLGNLKCVEWIRLEHNKLKCIPPKLVTISPKVLWYMSNNPLSSECKNWSEQTKNTMDNKS